MSASGQFSSRVWSVILAGGEGERVRPLVQRWLGRHRPKQYCTFVGSRSMFQHTIDRAGRLTPAARMVTVIAKSHRREAFAQLGRPKGGVGAPATGESEYRGRNLSPVDLYQGL